MAFLDKTGLEHLWAQIVNKLAGKSDKGHTHTTAEIGAVSQGTGAGQGANKVHIGWASDSSGLKATVDGTDLGYIYTSAIGKRALSTEGGTMIGEIVATNNNGGFRCDNGTYSIGLRIGASGVSRGIYDDTNGRWILYSDGTATTKVGGSQDPAQSCLRNIGCGTAALVAGSSILTTGAIYIQYE